ncbi:hypothetical protein A1395_22445 [Pseudomonas protegens]|nr:hypothetical protein A1395_22445 [Pseudomonas protegens]
MFEKRLFEIKRLDLLARLDLLRNMVITGAFKQTQKTPLLGADLDAPMTKFGGAKDQHRAEK